MASIALESALEDAQHPQWMAWRPLRYFNVYRLLIGALFVGLLVPETVPSPIGLLDLSLFRVAALVYLGVGIAFLLASLAGWPAYVTHLVLGAVADIVLLSVMMYASGGVKSGFGLLVMVAVTGGSLLSSGRMGLAFAALAAVAVLVQQIYVEARVPWLTSEYAHAAMLGVAFFASALIGWFAAGRIRASEALVALREDDLATLAELNEHIIERMQSGVLAIGPQGQIRLINQSARRLLGLARHSPGARLRQVAPPLAQVYERWLHEPGSNPFFLPPSGSQLRLQASFAALGSDAESGTLAFLEDGAALAQRAQQLKMASVGRLAGSIAHEIRNPLSAIRHASQLLDESDKIAASDKRLAEIIGDNTGRMNTIVENVLQISRGKPAAPTEVELLPWLRNFCAELERNLPGVAQCVVVEVEPADMIVRVDPSQLHQIVWNLCENAVQHTGEDRRLVLRGSISPESRRPCLDVEDNGPGVPAHDVDSLFEPFFTTRTQGSGLGLYIARGLSEGNQATLDYVAEGSAGACFRLTFNDPRRLTSYME